MLKNLESVFTGAYLNHSEKPSKLKESISQGTKLRRKTSNDFLKKKKKKRLSTLSCLEND